MALCFVSLILPDWQSPEISRASTSTAAPWGLLFLIVPQFCLPEDGLQEELLSVASAPALEDAGLPAPSRNAPGAYHMISFQGASLALPKYHHPVAQPRPRR
jgi:hypothetical protein